MKISIEIRSDISRRELRQLLDIAVEAANRLGHRMTAGDLYQLQNAGAMLIGIAESERRNRSATVIEGKSVTLADCRIGPQ